RGQLEYRATAHLSGGRIIISKIETFAEAIETAIQAVYFLIGTHVMGQVLPHKISLDPAADEHKIAVTSFIMYGRFACYATSDDVTKVPILDAEA
ncbi:MAG: hypothetical protein AAF512_21685, partial [Pseudomonadota bacterium]